jgi:signal transduction histidine kinase
MRRRILLLVAATTSAVVLAFVIPLCLLVRTLAADRALAEADQEARNVAVLVSSLHDSATLEDAVATTDARSVAATSVTLADGRRIGTDQVSSTPSAAQLDRARAGSAFTVRGESGALIVVPVVTAAGTDVVATWVPAEELRRGVGQAWALIAFLGLALTVIALLIADRLGRRVSTPVTHVALIADRLREGDLGARAVPEGPPETQALATALNGLAERIEELLLLERTAVADLSHRLRTPVTALRIDVERVPDEALAERLRRHVGNLQRSVDAIVKDARRPIRHGMELACDAVAVVRAAADFWSPLAEDQGRSLRIDLAEGPLMVDLDAVDLRDVVDILIDNVFAHTPDGTPFEVSLHRSGPSPVDNLGGVLLEVVDGAPAGAAHPQAERAGGAGATTGTTTENTAGSGLGLSIARRAVASRGGELHVEITPTGTRVTARLPDAPAR